MSLPRERGNNGSAFAGNQRPTPSSTPDERPLNALRRFLFIVPMMAVAGSLVNKKIVPSLAGTFPTTSSLFVALLVGVILIVGGLVYFPALGAGSDRRAPHDDGWKIILGEVLMAERAQKLSLFDPRSCGGPCGIQ